MIFVVVVVILRNLGLSILGVRQSRRTVIGLKLHTLNSTLKCDTMTQIQLKRLD